MVQWLRLCASTARGVGSIPVQGPKILHAALCSQKEISKNNAPQSLQTSESPLCIVLITQLCPTLCDPWTVTRLLCPWNSAGKNTGVGRHALLQGSSRPSEATFTPEPPGKPEDLLKYRLLVLTSAFPIQLVIWCRT